MTSKKPDSYKQSFAHLLDEISKCRVCKKNPQGKPLPHEPRPVLQASTSARILIAGQAPGMRVHKSGTLFADPSGERLRDWMGIDDEIFYDPARVAIVPMGFCFPGYDAKNSDLPPRKECAPHWRQNILSQLHNLELVLVIGQYAQKWHLGKAKRATLTETVMSWREYVSEETYPKVLPLPHPSWRNNIWLKKNPWFEAETLPYLRTEIARLIARH